MGRTAYICAAAVLIVLIAAIAAWGILGPDTGYCMTYSSGTVSCSGQGCDGCVPPAPQPWFGGKP